MRGYSGASALSAICSTSCQMLLGAAEISIIRVHTASYAITFLPGGSFFVAFDLESVWILFRV